MFNSSPESLLHSSMFHSSLRKKNLFSDVFSEMRILNDKSNRILRENDLNDLIFQLENNLYTLKDFDVIIIRDKEMTDKFISLFSKKIVIIGPSIGIYIDQKDVLILTAVRNVLSREFRKVMLKNSFACRDDASKSTMIEKMVLCKKPSQIVMYDFQSVSFSKEEILSKVSQLIGDEEFLQLLSIILSSQLVMSGSNSERMVLEENKGFPIIGNLIINFMFHDFDLRMESEMKDFPHFRYLDKGFIILPERKVSEFWPDDLLSIINSEYDFDTEFFDLFPGKRSVVWGDHIIFISKCGHLLSIPLIF